MHWPFPPNPAEYQSPGLGLVMAMLALAVIFVAVLFYAARSNASLLHEPKPGVGETGCEERESDKVVQ